MIEQKNRVFVTGIGILSSIGSYGVMPDGSFVDEFYQAVRRGDSGISLIDPGIFKGLEAYDKTPEKFPIKIAGHVKDFDPVAHKIEGATARRLDRTAQFAIAASNMALRNAGLTIGYEDGNISPNEVCIDLGAGEVGSITYAQQYKRFLEGKRLSPFGVTRIMSNAPSSEMSIYHGINVGVYTHPGACASSGIAIGEGFRRVQRGERDVVIAGGLEACIDHFTMALFDTMGALSHNESPVYRVYDRDSNGFVMGEGAAFLILENVRHAEERGATVLAEIFGYGYTMDASKSADPDPEGRQVVRAINLGLEDAGLTAEQIEYINTHGTGTKNDPIEVRVVKSVFGERAGKIPVSSLKPMLGHPVGAATAMELAGTIMAMNSGFVPPTINLESPIDDEIDFVPNEARKYEFNTFVKFSSGFGVHNVGLIAGKPRD